MTWCPQPRPDLYTPEQIEAAKDMGSMRWTQEEFDKHIAQKAARLQADMQPRVIKAAVEDKVVNQAPHAGGPRYKSKWEPRFAQTLEFRRQAGELVWYQYEALTLLLPGDVRYKPDFVALKADGGMEVVEVKGQLREPARIKLRQAIHLHPHFEWYWVGGDMTPRRLYTPGDVPATTRSKK